MSTLLQKTFFEHEDLNTSSTENRVHNSLKTNHDTTL